MALAVGLLPAAPHLDLQHMSQAKLEAEAQQLQFLGLIVLTNHLMPKAPLQNSRPSAASYSPGCVVMLTLHLHIMHVMSGSPCVLSQSVKQRLEVRGVVSMMLFRLAWVQRTSKVPVSQPVGQDRRVVCMRSDRSKPCVQVLCVCVCHSARWWCAGGASGL